MTKLPNPCQAYLAAKIPADHSETGCATIHLVDLHDVVDFADSLSAFAEQALLVSEGSFFIFGPGWRMFTIQLNLVVDLCFGRQQFGREIKRNTRFGFRLIKREPFAHEPIEFRKPSPQVLHGLGFKREQLAICECLDGGRTRRAVQDRQFTEKVTLAIKREIARLSVDSSKGPRASLLHYVKRTGIVSFTDN